MFILNDVNLSEIIFSSDGRDISFEFINMTDGAFICTLKCKSVYIFNYNNTFDENESLACYVGEVTCEKILNSHHSKWLEEKKFTFRNPDQSIFIPTKNELINFHIEGGDIVIDLTCEAIEKDKNLIKL